MNMYLSWSITYFVIVVVLFLVAYFVSRNYLKKSIMNDPTLKDETKKGLMKWVNWSFVIFVSVIMFLAFDTGDTKIQSYRSNFDIDVDRTAIQKVESTRETPETIKKRFEESLNKQ